MKEFEKQMSFFDGSKEFKIPKDMPIRRAERQYELAIIIFCAVTKKVDIVLIIVLKNAVPHKKENIN